MVKRSGPTKLQSSKKELRALDINGQHVLKSSDKCLAQQSLRVLYPTYTLGFLFLTLSKIFGLCSTFEDVEFNISFIFYSVFDTHIVSRLNLNSYRKISLTRSLTEVSKVEYET